MRLLVNLALAALGALVCCNQAFAQLQVLTYRPVDFVYSKGLDKLILLNASPAEVRIYDPASEADSRIALPYAPSAVALDPAGLFAAVAHNGYVSWVDLQSRTVVRTVAFGYDVAKVAVASGYIYAFPRQPIYDPGTNREVKYVSTSDSTVLSTTAIIGAQSSSTVLVSPDGTAVLISPSPYGTQALAVAASGALTPKGPSLSCMNGALDAGRLLDCSGTIYLSDAAYGTATYRATLTSAPTAAAFSPQRDELALIHASVSPAYGPVYSDTDLYIYNNSYLGQTGRVPFPQFTAGTKTAKSSGKYAAYTNDSSRLIAVVQADAAAGLLNDFGIVAFREPGACTTTALDPGTVTLPAEGGNAQVSISSEKGCLWRAVSNAAWLTVPRTTIGSDGSKITIFATLNPGVASRSATVTVGNMVVNVSQAGRVPARSLERIPYNVVDAGFSKSLNRMVLISTNPDQLHLYDAASQTETATYQLPAAPNSLTVSTDGLFAGVGFDGRIVRMNLQTGATTHNFLVATQVARLALNSSFLYQIGITPRDSDKKIRAIRLSDNTETMSEPLYDSGASRQLVLSDDGNSLFQFDEQVAVRRFRLANGIPSTVTSTLSRGGSCGKGWVTSDGLRVFTACGNVYRLSEATSQDLQYGGRLPGFISGLAYLPGKGSLFLIPNDLIGGFRPTEVQRLAYENLTYVSKAPFGSLPVKGVDTLMSGLHVFASADETTISAVVWYGNQCCGTPVYGIYSAVIDSQTICTYSVSPSSVRLPQSGEQRLVSVTTQPGCSWSGQSSANWLSSTGSTTGSGTFLVYAQPNTSSVARTGTISLPNASLTVTQLSTDWCSYNTPSEIAFIMSGNSSNYGIPMEATVGCAWTATISTPQVLGIGGSGTGPGSITVYNSSFTTAQTAKMNVAGQSIDIGLLPSGGCTPSFSTNNSDSNGGTKNVTLSFTGTCPANWSLKWNSSWIQIFPVSGSTAAPQAVRLTIYPNLTRNFRSGLLSFGTNIAAVPITQSGSSALPNSRFISRAYFAAFGRLPSQAEIDLQINNGLNKGLTQTDIMMNLINSPEFNQIGRYIAGLYVGLLARNAEYNGWLFQRNALTTNIVNQDQLVANFINSDERKLTFGTQSDAQFVQSLYKYVLLRDGQPSEVNFQVANLPKFGRVGIARNFLLSTEFQIGTGPRLTAFVLYGALLGRDPLPPELADAITRLTAGTPVKTLVQEIVESSEFAAQIN